MGLADVLFPRACAACGRGPWPFCPSCLPALSPIAHPMCERCGAPAGRPTRSCRECPDPSIERVRSAFVFAGACRSAILRLKFGGDRSVAQALGAAMVDVWRGSADVVAWVPLSRARLSRRGYDQARALATEVSHRLDVRTARVLERTRDMGPQAMRNARERRIALDGAFAVRLRPPPRVLLIDDVLTTGATVAECARALRASGASRVEVLTAARAISPR